MFFLDFLNLSVHFSECIAHNHYLCILFPLPLLELLDDPEVRLNCVGDKLIQIGLTIVVLNFFLHY